MPYIAYITAAVLAVLKLMGTVSVSWAVIAGIALIPLLIALVLIAVGALAIFVAGFLED